MLVWNVSPTLLSSMWHAGNYLWEGGYCCTLTIMHQNGSLKCPAHQSSLLVSFISSEGFPLFPFTGPFLLGFSHLLFLPSLLHLRLFLCMLQMWMLSRFLNPSVYRCKPALEVKGNCDGQDFRHTSGQQSLVLGAELCRLKSDFTAAARSFCSTQSGLQTSTKILKQEVFPVLFCVPSALSFPGNTARTFPCWDNLSLPFWS